MPNTRILLIGHSHANCMAMAMKEGLYRASTPGLSMRLVGNGARALPGGLVVKDGLQRTIANPVILKAVQDNVLARERPEVWLVSVLGGNLASRMSLFRTGSHDYWIAGIQRPSGAPPEDSVLVPRDAIITHFMRKLESLNQLFFALGGLGLKGVVHLEAPPPVEDARHIFENLPAKTVELAKKNGLGELSMSSIAPALFRLEAWKCQAEATRRIACAAGVHYLAPPQDVCDGLGYLRSEYYADAMHASKDYGARVLVEVEKFVARMGDDSSEKDE